MKYIALLSLILCTMCSLVPEPSCPSKRFIIQPKITLSSDTILNAVNLFIEKPELDSTIHPLRPIVYLSPYQVDFLAGTEWNNALNTILQESILHAFQDSSSFGNVQIKNLTKANYCLKIQVRNFGLKLEEESKKIHLTYSAQIIKLSNSKIVAVKLFDNTSTHKWKSNESYIQELNNIHAQLTKEIYNFTIETLSNLS